jgi:hypothetical protein
MNSGLSRNGRIRLVAGVALAGAVVFCLLPPLAQPESYHHFIDDRTMLGIPNCLNVVSNLPFAVVGVMGLCLLARKAAPGSEGSFLETGERLPYAVFFAGAFLTCFGSGYYHWSPNDATLVWDRLPMTLAFMGLLAAIVAERIDVRAGLRLLWPLVLVGVGSVGWWRWTGNLWPYAGAQYFSILLIALLMALFPPRYTRSCDLLWVTGFYALAKVFEAMDRQIFSLIRGTVSGHTIKHLVAALAVYWVVRMLQQRKTDTQNTKA